MIFLQLNIALLWTKSHNVTFLMFKNKQENYTPIAQPLNEAISFWNPECQTHTCPQHPSMSRLLGISALEDFPLQTPSSLSGQSVHKNNQQFSKLTAASQDSQGGFNYWALSGNSVKLRNKLNSPQTENCKDL